MKVIGIIQARMGSTRLPGKALVDIFGKTMLDRVVSRCQRSKKMDEIVVATTTQPEDDVISRLCVEKNWPCFRGSVNDLLDRYFQAAVKYKADIVVRITSDCPMIEPEIIDQTVSKILEEQSVDYASNTIPPRKFPRGLDVEAIAFSALERTWNEDINPQWREHVTPYIYNNPEKFRLCPVTNEEDFSSYRWTVDTPGDLTLVRKIYKHFGNDEFSWRDAIHLVKSRPEWTELNKHVPQKEI